ncbi:MAG: primosomal protein N' [Gemmatimonadaceae bacterium]|nr:primosomal protein N' [Gemmatimonadaceae bacterium]
MPRLVDVALPVPLFRTFSYAVDRDFAHPIAVGSRVVVPWRNRADVGIVVATDAAPLEGVKYKAVTAVPDPEPALSPSLVATCHWLADYYVAPLGMTLRSALPAALTGVDVPSPPGKTRRALALAQRLDSLMARDALFKRAPRQREVYELLEASGGRASVEHVVERLGVSEGVIDALVKRGVVEVLREAVNRDPFAARPGSPPPAHAPTSAQQEAIARITAGKGGDVFLLHGVTGSGKTLVYLEVLRRLVIDLGRTAIVLVPEIALTPQTVDRFRGVFGDRVAVLHSALSDGERLDAWRALKRGEKRIAVGARSAIFAPLDDVGAIIVDEEHETSYKQNETPRYHARDVAIVRARHAGAVTVLGSATPSLESWVLAREGTYHLLTLPERVGGGVLPEIAIVDLGGVRRGEGEEWRAGEGSAIQSERMAAARGAPPENQPTPPTPTTPHHSIPLRTISSPNTPPPPPPPPPQPPTPTRIPAPPRRLTSPASHDPFRRVVSDPLERAIRDTLAAREQTILLLNRRGYSSFIQCTTCGDVSACPNCSISLTLHRTPERLVCHYCGHAEEIRRTCERCGAATMRQRGLGTQQVERLLVERFADARIARMDVDTTSGKWAHAEILDRVGAGDIDILLGTQMIAKGLDFPNVTLVGVIDADVGINLPDFRAAERTFQLLAQVAGRAGRSTKAGRVIIQTRMGNHHALRCAVHHDYQGFVDEELPGRVSPPYPPTIRLANVIFSATAEDATATLAQRATDWLRRLATARPELQLTIVGPAPCPVDRIKQRWRWHTLVKAHHGPSLTRALRYFAERYEVPNKDGMRLVVDRDPVSLM